MPRFRPASAKWTLRWRSSPSRCSTISSRPWAVPSEPILLAADKFRIHNAAVPRYVDSTRSADRKKTVEGVRPRRHIGIGIDGRVAGFLDKVTGEDYGPLSGGTWHRDDEIGVGVAVPRPCDGHLAVPEVDECVGDGVLGHPQCGDRMVNLGGVRSVTHRVIAQLSKIDCEVVQNFWCTEYLSTCKSPGAQHVIEVLVGQHQMRHAAPGNQAHIVVD